MNARESLFYPALRAALGGHFVRVENTIGRGTPDVWWSFGSHHYWIEVKVFENGIVKIRPEQMAWMTKESSNGGTCFIIAKNYEEKYIAVWKFAYHAFAFKKPYHYPIYAPTFTVTRPSQIKPAINNL